MKKKINTSNLSAPTINGIGTLISVTLLTITGLFVVGPLMESRSDSASELKSMKVITEAKKSNLERLSEGAVNYDQALRDSENYARIVTKDKDIESASRAISRAAIPEVTITSFTFNSEEAVKKNDVPAVSLGEYVRPSSFAEAVTTTRSTPGAVPTTPSAGLKRLPVTISVNAVSYQKLSEYTDRLAQEDRLLSVISISAGSNGTADKPVRADIYAYALVDNS